MGTETETNEPGQGTDGLEPTTTSETNTTVHLNGKKCVNKIKLTHRKVNVTCRERVIGGRVDGTIVQSKPTTEQGFAEKEDSALKVSETGHSKTTYSDKDKVAEVGISRDGEKTTDVGLFGTKQNETKTLRVSGTPPFHRLPPKGPYQHRPNLNMRPFRNRTRSPSSAPTKLNESKTSMGQPMTGRQVVFAKTLPVSQSSTLHPDAQPERAPKSSSESEQSGKEGYSSSSSTSEESDSTKENAAVAENGIAVTEDGMSTDADRATDVVSSGTERNKSKTLTVGGTPPSHRIPPKGTQQCRSHPNMGPFQKRTRTNLRPPQHPSRGPIRRPFQPKLTNRDNGIIVHTTQPEEQGTYRTSQNDTNTDLKPETLIKRANTTASKIAEGQTYIRNSGSLSQSSQDSKTGHHDKGSQVSKTADSTDRPNQINGSDATTTGKTGQPLNSVGVQSITSGGFVLVWGAPEGMYRNFIVTREEHGSKNEAEEEEVEEGESEMGVSQGKEGGEENPVTNSKSDNQRQNSNSNTMAKVGDGGTIKFSKVLPGSARSFPFQNLHPQTRYSLSVFGKGPGLRSKIHRLIVSTAGMIAKTPRGNGLLLTGKLSEAHPIKEMVSFKSATFIGSLHHSQNPGIKRPAQH
ncbi:uncharacterized protein ACWYII_023953 isoform 2-T2 [Salvelinus alpinus]